MHRGAIKGESSADTVYKEIVIICLTQIFLLIVAVSNHCDCINAIQITSQEVSWRLEVKL
jgi:hypothetical protein